MITPQQKKTLKKFLSLAPEPEDAFTYDELMGYMFGIAMTPDILLPSEWLPVIFRNGDPGYASMEQAQEMMGCLMQVYNSFISAFNSGSLEFPYDFLNIDAKAFESVIEWVFGFEAALALRPGIWEPEESLHIPEETANNIFSSLMVIQGLTDFEDIANLSETLPKELTSKAFSEFEIDSHTNEAQLKALLLVSLPTAINTLQNYAKAVSRRRQSPQPRPVIPIPLRPVKTGRNDQCSCKSGKELQKGCGQSETAANDLGSASQPSKKAKIIQGKFPQHQTRRTDTPPVYQLKIALKGAKPPIWRRIQVPGTTTLFSLHEIIQYCMGWTDTHLHHFVIDRSFYALPDEEDDWYQINALDERSYTLKDLEKKLQPSFQYTYDFGDDWIHTITIEKILAPAEGSLQAALLTGKRACPPENVGGIYGYLSLLESLNDPEDEYHEQALEILGNDFQPEKFSKEEIAEINEALRSLK